MSNIIYNVARNSGKTTRLVEMLNNLSDEELTCTYVIVHKMDDKKVIFDICNEKGFYGLFKKIKFTSNIKNIRGHIVKNVFIDDYFSIGTLNKKELMFYINTGKNIIVFDSYNEYSESFIELVRSRDVLMDDTFKHLYDLEYNIYFNNLFTIKNSLD